MIFIWLDPYEKMEQLSCLHLSLLLRNEQVTDPLAVGWRWSTVTTRFMLCIYHFIQVNGCIITPVVKARACHHEVLGSSPIMTFFSIFSLLWYFFVFCSAWASNNWAYCFFSFTNPDLLVHPWPNFFYYFLFLIFVLFLFFYNIFYLLLLLLLSLLLFLLIKKSTKIFYLFICI